MLDLAVVPWGVGTGPLVAWGQGGDGRGEGPGTAEEADRGGGLLIIQGLGVGQTREAVDGGVQVGVADPGSFALFGGFGFGGSSPVGPPGSPRWDASDLLDVQVDHVAREAGKDRFADPIGLPGGAWCRAVGSGRLCPAIGSRYAPTPLSRAQPARG